MKVDQKNFIQLEFDSLNKNEIRRHGKFIPFGGTPKQPLLLIGPDWRFFVGMFTFLSIVGITSSIICYFNQKSIWAFVGSIAVTVLELFIYAFTALKDPGIVQEPEISIDQEEQEEQGQDQSQPNQSNACLICRVSKKKGRYHCSFCDVCIDGHDHHCPWASKCIGKGNLIPFYAFLLCTSIFFIYHFLVSLNKVLNTNYHQ